MIYLLIAFTILSFVLNVLLFTQCMMEKDYLIHLNKGGARRRCFEQCICAEQKLQQSRNFSFHKMTPTLHTNRPLLPHSSSSFLHYSYATPRYPMGTPQTPRYPMGTPRAPRYPTDIPRTPRSGNASFGLEPWIVTHSPYQRNAKNPTPETVYDEVNNSLYTVPEHRGKESNILTLPQNPTESDQLVTPDGREWKLDLSQQFYILKASPSTTLATVTPHLHLPVTRMTPSPGTVVKDAGRENPLRCATPNRWNDALPERPTTEEEKRQNPVTTLTDSEKSQISEGPFRAESNEMESSTTLKDPSSSRLPMDMPHLHEICLLECRTPLNGRTNLPAFPLAQFDDDFNRTDPTIDTSDSMASTTPTRAHVNPTYQPGNYWLSSQVRALLERQNVTNIDNDIDKQFKMKK